HRMEGNETDTAKGAMYVPENIEGRFTRGDVEAVWRRIMPGADPSEFLEALNLRDIPGTMAPDSAGDPLADRPPETLFADEENPCFSETDAETWGLLRGLIDEELERARYYETLSEYASSRRERRLLMSLAEDDLVRARTLASAYFLCSGEVYRPDSAQGFSEIPAYRQAVRAAYRAERRAAFRYIQIAEDIGKKDACLAELMDEASGMHTDHSIRLRTLIEAYLF
ncbi:hypothetical protein LJC32_05050, partial [Oscillospiraceae bacterium OttesenSCG-928-F05]|nr:hypothetical protein [Oscillospiraceae bacterium OttesenSCG-928-F05]